MPNRIFSSKGFAPLLIIVVVAVVILGAGAVFFINKGSVPGLNTIKNSVSNAAGSLSCNYNDKDLCKFITNWKDMSNYKVTITTTAKDGSKSESLFELSGENNFHMSSSEKGKEVLNMITMGDTTYTKDYTDNKWWKQKVTKDTAKLKDDVEFKVPDSTESAKTEDKTTYKLITKEVCGNLQCFKYQIIDPQNTETTEYIWFDDKDYLLRKERSEGKDGTISEMVYSYDKVTITAPSPTKELGKDEVAVPGGGKLNVNTANSADLEKAAQEAQKALQDFSTSPTNTDNSTDTAPDESGQ